RLTQSTAYDAAGRMIRRTVQRERAPMPLAERKYRYDAAGQLTEIEDRYQGYTDYRYDPIGRLIEAKSPVGRERFAFDPASNIVDPPATAETRTPVSYAREDSTLPAQVPKVLGNLLKAYAGTHFTYDARGNLIHRRSAQDEQRYEWDAFNRLHAARVDETTRRSESRYYYDALGRRIAKDVNGTRTVFGWDGDTLAYESTEDGATHYVYEAGSFVPLVQFVAGPVQGTATPVWRPDDHYLPEEDSLRQVPQRTSDAHVFYYHCDQIGTPLMMTDELGEVVWEASYKAWGEAQQVIARASKAAGIAPKNLLRFQGQQLDDESGLHYNRHRYYDPNTGRFISADPIGLAGGINLHQYVPNPAQWIDPLGLWGSSPLTKYRYNADGSLKSATAKIRPEDLGTGTPTNASSRLFARTLGCKGDDAGHAIGNRLGGSGGKGNVFPQAASVNRGEFRDFEGDIAEAVKSGSNVIVRVVPQYDEGSTRPHSVLYQARVDGQTESRIFSNPCPCKC
ncbi:RHS repeat-associated core domain-containing protein, partial [Trinickia fusca]|uniref:RHS repeat-associated core domain-containing protein n=1 Tax=Trinickia fusca TaxID=2419777 RepID=UPI001603C6C2